MPAAAGVAESWRRAPGLQCDTRGSKGVLGVMLNRKHLRLSSYDNIAYDRFYDLKIFHCVHFVSRKENI